MTVSCGLTKNFTQLFIARMGVGAGEAGLTPPAYSIILDSFRPRHVGYAMSVYKLGVNVGGGLALVVGGLLYDYFAGLGSIVVPVFGELKPWQATIVCVGLPGLILSLMLLTIREPSRKSLAEGGGGEGLQLPIRTVAAFVWSRKRVYLTLFFGSSMMAMAGYGSAAWYPEFFVRTYGMSKSEAGTSYGTIILIAGSLGVMLGAWVASKLSDWGYTDGYVRAIFLSALLAIPLTISAPLAGDAQLTLLILFPATLMSSAYMGVMAVAIVTITPNQMRGQVTAVYIFVTNMLGMAVGTSILAAFTDFLYQGDDSLHYSIATANGLFYPIAALLFWYCLPAYRRSAKEIGKWKLG
jgi:MFS family permease